MAFGRGRVVVSGGMVGGPDNHGQLSRSRGFLGPVSIHCATGRLGHLRHGTGGRNMSLSRRVHSNSLGYVIHTEIAGTLVGRIRSLGGFNGGVRTVTGATVGRKLASVTSRYHMVLSRIGSMVRGYQLTVGRGRPRSRRLLRNWVLGRARECMYGSSS